MHASCGERIPNLPESQTLEVLNVPGGELGHALRCHGEDGGVSRQSIKFGEDELGNGDFLAVRSF